MSNITSRYRLRLRAVRMSVFLNTRDQSEVHVIHYILGGCGNCFLGDRYVVLEDGLQILNATDSDSGNYTCRAEVDEFGNYAERFISVSVNSAYFIF